jgi:plastocyanin
MKKTLIFLTLIILIALVLSACQKGSEPAAGGEAQDDEITLEIKASPTEDGAVLTFETANIKIAKGHQHDGSKKAKKEGHLHIIIDDGAYIPITDSTYTATGLEPGKHTVKAVLHYGDHSSTGLEKTIEFEVKGPNTGTAAPKPDEEPVTQPDEKPVTQPDEKPVTQPDEKPATPPDVAIKLEPVKVDIKVFKFVPAEITVRKGTTVIFHNLDDVVHTATADNIFDTGDIKKDGSYSIQFDEVGEFSYYCKPHPFMKAKIIVTD